MPEGITKRYSEAFKAQVIKEIEAGTVGMAEARRRYGIAGSGTIHWWLKKRGQNHLLNKVVRVERADERDRVKELESEKRRLESALAQSQLKVLALEELIKVAEEKYRFDIKKKSGGKP
jgi:transposase-like protein